jgi:cephalosporin hydroxylase
MFDREAFDTERALEIAKARQDDSLIKLGREFVIESDKHKYGYYWDWMGLPIIQMPEDIVITQEILWELKPNIVIEAGIAWGGSLAMYAAFQELQGFGKVFGIDTTIPKHNKEAIMLTPVSHRINLIEGSSTDDEIFRSITAEIPNDSRILLVLDSNHTHEHVFNELTLWSSILRKGDFIIVSDTIVELIPEQKHRPRPWGHGNNPMTGMMQFLEVNKRFTSNNKYSRKAFSTFNPSGYLKCTG